LLAGICCCLVLSACGNLLSLKEELKLGKQEFRTVSVTLVSENCVDCPIVIAGLEDRDGKQVTAVKVFETASEATITVPVTTRYLFAFHDINRDFECQDNEPRGWAELPKGASIGGNPGSVQLLLGKPAASTRPSRMENLYSFELKHIRTGKIVRLDDPRFSQENATQGMWQPLTFLRQHHAGVYFLEEYSKEKTPVLFVHGIDGTPRNFVSMIDSLDRDKYQPWLLYYPSGLDLDVLSNGLYVLMNTLHHRYGFKKLHVVAHSMGGLVARGYLGKCSRDDACGYLRSYVSLASPYGGNTAAANGARYSPVVMPVWTSLAPDSQFLATLFDQPLPDQASHYLLFTYRNGGGLNRESGDGTIPLSSQLRPAAQDQATLVHGFNNTHMDVLQNPDVLKRIGVLLDKGN
jgi:pimeloyl-ACP methyl ester carboxylesterase